MTPWTPESVLAITRAFMESRIMLTGVELDVFTLLSGSPKSAGEVAAALLTAQRGTAILLDALTAMGLLDKKNGRYSCQNEIAELLSADSPATVLPMAHHAAGLWRRWSELTHVVQYGSADRPAAVRAVVGEAEMARVLGWAPAKIGPLKRPKPPFPVRFWNFP